MSSVAKPLVLLKRKQHLVGVVIIITYTTETYTTETYTTETYTTETYELHRYKTSSTTTNAILCFFWMLVITVLSFYVQVNSILLPNDISACKAKTTLDID